MYVGMDSCELGILWLPLVMSLKLSSLTIRLSPDYSSTIMSSPPFLP
ncbi:hypothetical protein Lalb_Chr09g0332301 [Lupinus albus]|uniref:Uncharacterized protein n=1 Tax=Lupinus albus TaxID=3870 RepID=A0A6A4PNM6_LUPAL|nr:hypothetical protein Lalb_Chr12g0206921 [Lupinus albus]KAE9607652.1 hypothetical protein Lalb_Chr09g0332301 [Lupinus albus]